MEFFLDTLIHQAPLQNAMKAILYLVATLAAASIVVAMPALVSCSTDHLVSDRSWGSCCCKQEFRTQRPRRVLTAAETQIVPESLISTFLYLALKTLLGTGQWPFWISYVRTPFTAFGYAFTTDEHANIACLIKVQLFHFLASRITRANVPYAIPQNRKHTHIYIYIYYISF